ncbi:hypothetical protein CERSUDRAFT_71609 [Gelatoporia subvermispora B]|uniref:Uncharacterized protein n=1 Tax=Ceriporiopsis subvermispora (strain B) TaxID=914234 RepID=M2RMP3_CERS8|nr:hypothetical protein CERSUDRAFT_71609 [Gelatoporia subvermispora B]
MVIASRSSSSPRVIYLYQKEVKGGDSDSDSDKEPSQPVRSSGIAKTKHQDIDKEKFAWGFKIAKTPAYPCTKAANPVHGHGASDFTRYLEDYCQRAPGASRKAIEVLSTAIESSQYLVYMQFKVRLPDVPQVHLSKKIVLDTVHASPAQPSKGPQPAVAPFFLLTVNNNGHKPWQYKESEEDRKNEDDEKSEDYKGCEDEENEKDKVYKEADGRGYKKVEKYKENKENEENEKNEEGNKFRR